MYLVRKSLSSTRLSDTITSIFDNIIVLRICGCFLYRIILSSEMLVVCERHFMIANTYALSAWKILFKIQSSLYDSNCCSKTHHISGRKCLIINEFYSIFIHFVALQLLNYFNKQKFVPHVKQSILPVFPWIKIISARGAYEKDLTRNTNDRESLMRL